MKTASLISPVRNPDRLEEVKSDMTFISTQERKTALFHAVEKGHILIVKELLDAGANTETTNKVIGVTVVIHHVSPQLRCLRT